MSAINVNFEVLNQRGTPAIFAAPLADQPAPGFPGRLFIDTNNPSTGIYRDTGTSWLHITAGAIPVTPDLQSVTSVGNMTSLGIIYDNNGASFQYVDPNSANGFDFYNQLLGRSEYAIVKRAQGILTSDVLDIHATNDIASVGMGVYVDGRNEVIQSYFGNSYEEIGLRLDFGNNYYRLGNLQQLGDEQGLYIDSVGAGVIGGTSVNPAAAFQIDSVRKGFLPPRMTSTQRNAIAAPPDGLMIYNTSEKRLDHYGNGAWQQLADTTDLTSWFKLSFNSIPDYVVVGGAGIQDLGAGTNGMNINFDINNDRNLYTKTGSNYVFNIKLITLEQFGGVPINIGCGILYSSTAAAGNVQSLAAGNYKSRFGTNFANQDRTFTLTVPDTVGGQPTNFFQLNVLVERLVGGNTSIIGATICLNYV